MLCKRFLTNLFYLNYFYIVLVNNNTDCIRHWLYLSVYHYWIEDRNDVEKNVGMNTEYVASQIQTHTSPMSTMTQCVGLTHKTPWLWHPQYCCLLCTCQGQVYSSTLWKTCPLPVYDTHLVELAVQWVFAGHLWSLPDLPFAQRWGYQCPLWDSVRVSWGAWTRWDRVPVGCGLLPPVSCGPPAADGSFPAERCVWWAGCGHPVHWGSPPPSPCASAPPPPESQFLQRSLPHRPTRSHIRSCGRWSSWLCVCVVMCGVRVRYEG